MAEITDQARSAKLASQAYDESLEGGFNFDNLIRNAMLSKTLGSAEPGVLPSAWKTGTTICGIVYKDGVVLGADTRATGGADGFDLFDRFEPFGDDRHVERRGHA